MPTCPIGDEGGTVRVELNHSDPRCCPPGFRLGDNDTRILSVARSLAAEGEDVVLVSKDLPLRVKAASIGLTAQEYRAELPPDSGWTGMRELEVSAADIDELYDTGRLDCAPARELPCHTGLVLVAAGGRAAAARSAGCCRTSRSGWSAATGRRSACAAGAPSSGSRSTCCSTPRSGSSRSAAGPAPASRRWRCAPGLEAVMERRQHRKVVVFRPLYAVGGQELGYLPGSEADKMNPWAQAVYDTLSAVTSQDVIDEVLARDMFEVLPLTHIRGRSLHDSFVIVDEAQSLERERAAHRAVPDRLRVPGGAHPRHRAARQPAGRPGTTAWSRSSRSSRGTRCSRT